MRFLASLTECARRALGQATRDARELRHTHLGTEHILLGLLHVGAGVASQALRVSGITHAQIRRQVQALIETDLNAPSEAPLPFTPRARTALLQASREAEAAGGKCVGTGHLLLGILELDDGLAVQALRAVGARPEDMRAQVRHVLAEGRSLDEREA